MSLKYRTALFIWRKRKMIKAKRWKEFAVDAGFFAWGEHSRRKKSKRYSKTYRRRRR